MNINEIIRADLCSGCGLCGSVFGNDKLSIELSESGFLRPKIKVDLSHSETALLNEFCPGVYLQHTPFKGRTDSHWGPVIQNYVGNATDEYVRHKGSSGGVISSLAIFLLENQIVKGVIQTTALESSPSHDFPPEASAHHLRKLHPNQYKLRQVKYALHAGIAL